MPYQPQSFVGAKGLAPLGRPSGLEARKAGDEFGYEIPEVRITPDGDFQGAATELWKGGREHVTLKSPNAGHGGHINALGLSLSGDLPQFDANLNNPTTKILPVWGDWGGFSVATYKPTLKDLTKYKTGPGWVEELPRQYDVRSGGEERRVSIRHPVVQMHFDQNGEQLNVGEARRRQEANKASSR